jgi:hypothetical protein
MAPRKNTLTRAKATKYTKVNKKTKAGESSNAQRKRKKGRGPTVIQATTSIVENRPEVWPVGKHEFTCDTSPNARNKCKPGKITAAITRITLNNMPGPLRSLHSFDPTMKNTVEFQFLVLSISCELFTSLLH